MGYATWVIGVAELATQQRNCMTKIAIGTKARIQHKEQSTADQQHNQGRAPHHICPGVKKVLELL